MCFVFLFFCCCFFACDFLALVRSDIITPEAADSLLCYLRGVGLFSEAAGEDRERER